ncbi:unnamed protein product [Chrysodeixis includens]|uniref:Uncharacterized protein n=1 Tax=Chrysodeixis includens TaxID=689277 RepID=A0A9P0BRV5_CHRIL|nr:unnamed protein product [Chrysodeixis includens]
MILLASIGLWHILCTYSMAVEDSHNVLLHDKTDYKVDLVITEDDYEMVGKHQLKDLEIDNKNKIRLNEFKKRMRAVNTKTTKAPKVETVYSTVNGKAALSSNYMDTTDLYDTAATPVSKQDAMLTYPDDAMRPKLTSTFTPPHHGDADYILSMSPDNLFMPVIVVTGHNNYIITSYMGPRDDAHATKTKENETDYDYDSFLEEYYEQEKNESQSNDTYQIKKIALSDYGAIYLIKKEFFFRTNTENCTENVKGIGFQAVKCLLHDYKKEQRLTKDISARIWRIIQIWFLVYLAIAVPVYCTRGKTKTTLLQMFSVIWSAYYGRRRLDRRNTSFIQSSQNYTYLPFY